MSAPPSIVSFPAFVTKVSFPESPFKMSSSAPPSI